jgi:limonene-1,2-epoxide hydrolase
MSGHYRRSQPETQREFIVSDAIDVVQRFCDQWAKGGGVDTLVEYFTDDAVYHNIPVAPVTGRDAIRATIEMFTTGVDRMEFRVLHIAAAGDVVLTERVDVFVLPDKIIELPVMGTFELRDGRIAAWRDYFDLNQYMTQLQSA